MIAFLYLLQAAVSPAAASTVELSEPYRVVDAEQRHYFHVGGVLLAVKIDDDNYTIQRFSTDGLKQLSLTEDDEFPSGSELEAILEFDGKVHVFYSSWDRKAQTEQLFSRAIDPATGAFNGPGERIVAVEGKISGKAVQKGFAFNFAAVDKFAITMSADKATMLVRYRRKPEKRDDSISFDTIGLAVFGPGLKQLWKNELQMPYTEEKMDFWDVSVDGQGTAYILAKVRDGDGTEDRTRDEEPNYHGELFRIGAGATGITTTQLALGGKFIHSIALYEVPNRNKIAVAGLYNDGEGVADVKGFFTADLSTAGAVSEARYYEIPSEILKQYASRREAKKVDKEGGGELRSLYLDHVGVDSDGSLTLVAEQFEIRRTTTVNAQGQTTTTITYLYQDIVAARIRAGELAWVRRVPKTQAGPRNPGGMSYALFHSEGKVHLVYFDNLKNLELEADKQPSVHIDGQGGYLTAYSIEDATGTVKKSSILDSRGVEGVELFQVGVDRIEAIGPDTFVLEAYKKKKEDLLIRVTLD